MSVSSAPRGVARYTFRGNLRDTRHGWLRLTPAYSLHVVRELLAHRRANAEPVLDPFCGTGTTLLACAEAGVACDTVDVNPFLAWLARAKTAQYPEKVRLEARRGVEKMAHAARAERGTSAWRPPLHRIERWWDPATLDALARAHARIDAAALGPRAADLARLSFCRALMATSNASFGHQSMSFKAGSAVRPERARSAVEHALLDAFASVERGASASLGRAPRRVFLGDSRQVADVAAGRRYGTVITSPPYANRMSYIRELRPYMYWLGYLADGRDAGALDWRAIGGTWGAATSNLTSWQRPSARRVPHRGFASLLGQIEAESPILARYVERYFCDMAEHLASLAHVVVPGGEVHYVVGNSKFFDVLLPVERIFASLLASSGFEKPRVEQLRKRTSKRELYEYCVSARRA